ncbi:hypothetical protein PRUPE_1G385500 [Prunus persica]|uniref:Uncharacterized protein n=1 Tax=Prunus persica TaxID=3760 RepID=A0A251RCH5_PRUPE|nr:hypothetical protein PRUPE_1G385500 [Prunus persica]
MLVFIGIAVFVCLNVCFVWLKVDSMQYVQLCAILWPFRVDILWCFNFFSPILWLFRRALVKIFGHSFDILLMSVYNLAPPFDLMQCVCSCIRTCLLLELHFGRA